MTQQEILDYNKRCAEFIKLKTNQYDQYLLPMRDTWYGGNSYSEWADSDGYIDNSIYEGYEERCWALDLGNLIFHSDWNWIMRVKEAIQRNFYFMDILGCGICQIKGIEGKTKNPHVSVASDEPKEAVVQAINNFLIWYNNESSNKNN